MMMAASLVARDTHALVPSGWLGQQCPHPDQVKRRGGEDEVPVDARSAAVSQLAHQTDRLHPAETLLDQLSFLLTDGVARMSGGARIDRAAASRRLGILGHMRGDAHRAELVHECVSCAHSSAREFTVGVRPLGYCHGGSARFLDRKLLGLAQDSSNMPSTV